MLLAPRLAATRSLCFSLNDIAVDVNGCSLFPEYCHGQGCVCVLIKPPLFPLVSVYGRSSEVDHGKRS